MAYFFIHPSIPSDYVSSQETIKKLFIAFGSWHPHTNTCSINLHQTAQGETVNAPTLTFHSAAEVKTFPAFTDIAVSSPALGLMLLEL